MTNRAVAGHPAHTALPLYSSATTTDALYGKLKGRSTWRRICQNTGAVECSRTRGRRMHYAGTIQKWPQISRKMRLFCRDCISLDLSLASKFVRSSSGDAYGW